MCVSCAWAKPAEHHPFEFCENGAKATLWELTTRRCTPGILRQAHADRTRGVEGLRPRTARPAHPSAALRSRHRSLRALSTGRGVRGDRRGAQGARSEVRRVLFLGPRQPRDLLSVRPVRAAVRQQQPARQLQHVPRDDVGGAEEGDRRRRSARSCSTISRLRRDVLLRSEHRLQQPALAAPARRRRPSAACKIVTFNPVREKGLERFTNPQSPVEMLTGKETRISANITRCRPAATSRRCSGICQDVFAADDAAQAAGSRARPRLHRAAHHGFDAFEAKVRADVLGARSSASPA